MEKHIKVKTEARGTTKIANLVIAAMLILSVLALANFVSADGEQASFSLIPQNQVNVPIGNQFTINITIATGSWIDAVGIDELTFSKDIIHCTGIQRGDLFANATIWLPGTINNSTGTLTNSVWGSKPATNVGGIYATLTFDAISSGTAYINITKAAIAFNMTMVTFNITNNATVSVTSYIPDPPSGFNANPVNRTQINLVWTKGAKADKTYIEAKLGGYPADRTDGTNIYNDSGTSYSQSGLNPGEHWYYRAWSWNETGGFYSTTYSEAGATTYTNNGPIIYNENPENGSINVDKMQASVSVDLADSNGDAVDWTIQTSTG